MALLLFFGLSGVYFWFYSEWYIDVYEGASGDELGSGGSLELFDVTISHYALFYYAGIIMAAWAAVVVCCIRCKLSNYSCMNPFSDCCAATLCSGCAIAGALGFEKETREKRERADVTEKSAAAKAAAGGQSDAALVMAPMLPTLPGGLPGATEAV